MTSTYTCITCRVAFRDLEVQRQHYKSDWHRYNLKRKVAELPPVTVEDFQKRVIAQRSKADEVNRGKETLACKVCRKTFSTQNQYDNHLVSKKHKEKEKGSRSNSELSLDQDEPMKLDTEEPAGSAPVKRMKNGNESAGPENDMEIEVDSDVESVDSDEWLEDTENPVVNNDCLFCNHHSKSWVRNLKHMTTAHSFFIPDPEFCTDIKGLLVYLGQKVFAGYMCLWCNDKGKAFRSAEAARAHMLDKGHCKMLHEGEALAEYAEFYDYSASYPDHESSDPNAEVEIPELDDSDYQLVLPSGSVIGHRSLMRYYKQSLDPNRALAIPRNEKLRKVLCMYRALGWTGTQKEAIKQKAIDIKYMQRIQQKYSTKLNFKANKLQCHFRQQVNF
ncbi:zinc finger protein 622 [Nasonia vitripennis]|uniref:C2H2-type domain-containing protein n=1 Tax=Nasonia vitripennis TaxID=7425 RepID=A0A7M7IRJ4_NASVI|nr:zinc finger protein 622 [Nasonia vitripennis]XP_031785665.1 zinc finger protein 622 [Nasonia vitripennis]